jgi:hypothetical protein
MVAVELTPVGHEAPTASLEALYGERLHFPLALWRLAAMLPEPWKA